MLIIIADYVPHVRSCKYEFQTKVTILGFLLLRWEALTEGPKYQSVIERNCPALLPQPSLSSNMPALDSCCGVRILQNISSSIKYHYTRSLIKRELSLSEHFCCVSVLCSSEVRIDINLLIRTELESFQSASASQLAGRSLTPASWLMPLTSKYFQTFIDLETKIVEVVHRYIFFQKRQGRGQEK